MFIVGHVERLFMSLIMSTLFLIRLLYTRRVNFYMFSIIFSPYLIDNNWAEYNTSPGRAACNLPAVNRKFLYVSFIVLKFVSFNCSYFYNFDIVCGRPVSKYIFVKIWKILYFFVGAVWLKTFSNFSYISSI